MASPNISVLILTKNEQQDLPAALASVAWSDDIHVFDSHSTDQTAEIARAAGAHLHTRTFDDYATHRNAALELPFKHPWLFLLDADERPTPDLSAEMQREVERASASTLAFRLRRRDFLFGTWLRHAQISPFYIRLVRPGHARYTRSINEVLEIHPPLPDTIPGATIPGATIPGATIHAIAELTHPLDHFPFSKGIAHWVAKHNIYSTMEAELIVRRQGLEHPSLVTALTGPDFHTRRLHQKALFYRLPGRPLIKWLYMMFLRGAILDGPAGLTYATLQSIYEYLIVLKTKELRQPKNPI